MQTDHIIAWYAAMCEVYTEASGIGISVGHIAEWYLERWWAAFAEATPIRFSAA